jgi:hypothetical protein
MTLPASIRVNVRAPFPVRVSGASFIGVNKANGVWTISPDYRGLNPVISLVSTQNLAVQDTVTGQWATISAQLIAGSVASLNTYRIVTTTGAVTVLSTDVVLLLNKGASGASTIYLPTAASRAGVPVIIKDLTGDANTNAITIVPNGSETIDGFSAAAAAANGVAVIDADYGAKSFYPIAGGWYVR